MYPLFVKELLDQLVGLPQGEFHHVLAVQVGQNWIPRVVDVKLVPVTQKDPDIIVPCQLGLAEDQLQILHQALVLYLRDPH